MNKILLAIALLLFLAAAIITQVDDTPDVIDILGLISAGLGAFVLAHLVPDR